MANQMLFRRKGGDVPTTANADDSPDDPPESADANDVVECPNCKCQFDENTKDVVKPGLPVMDDQPKDGGSEAPMADLPVPGKLGAAHDAAYGAGVEGNLLADLKTKLR